ncbi:MOSC domain-containing protein [Aquimarina pacifica]|uniref:MOSC domain-containing protein n=1 Tax=Aquimarina pacifica TaxID=1296415 RepID=UPI00046F2197|nr:MOSC domain-containing protein [Aquimarina pacifica]
MKIISTNIAVPRTISWRGKDVKTGIYKSPVENPLYLDVEDVKDDNVIDRRYHGGVDKACYLYSMDNYSFWQKKYPNLDWKYGMFGENLTVEGFSESKVKIGAIYKIGTAIVQISRPRQPCYKLGVRFGTQSIIKQFINSLLSGVYVRVLEPGFVGVTDEFIIDKVPEEGVSVAELNTLMFHYDRNLHENLAKKALSDPLISESDKKYFRKKL